MRRREFIAGLGSAAAWPVVGRAQQQSDRMRRIGVLMAADEDDPQRKGWLSAFTQGLEDLGWTDGHNLRMDVRWAGENVDRMRILAKELADLQPDVIFSHTTPATAAVQHQTRTIPIVFTFVGDPVGEGFVAGLPRPGGNITGFIPQEESMAGKWVELLAEIAPGVKRVAAVFNPDTEPFVKRHFLPSFEEAARSSKVAPIIAPVHNEAEIEQAVTSLGRGRLRRHAGCFCPGPSRANHIAGGTIQCPGDLSAVSVC
jgi:putative tryptophan/tyrosine transport system substrate-binding protein